MEKIITEIQTKEYVAPVAEVVLFNEVDLITTSIELPEDSFDDLT